MFIVIKSEHYDCTNLICKKDTLEEAVAAVKDSMAQRINKNYHAGLTGTDITHENEDHYGFSFTFDVRIATLTVANPERIAHMTTGMGMTKRVSSGSFTKSQPTSPSFFFLTRNTKASSLRASTTVSMRRLRK